MFFSRGGVLLSNASSLHLFRTYLMGTGIIYFAMNGWCYFQVAQWTDALARRGRPIAVEAAVGRERSPERFRIL
jgi:hypothetical protein